MLKKYLEKLSKIEIDLIRWFKKIEYKWAELYVNPAIFSDSFSGDLYFFKKFFFISQASKRNKIKIIQDLYNSDKSLSENDLIILNHEINIKNKKLEFLEKSYDTEANKIDSSYVIKDKIWNYDTYNKLFYNVNKDDYIDYNKYVEIDEVDYLRVKKCDLLELLTYSKELVPELDFVLWKFSNFSHLNWILKIPNHDTYNLKSIITVFFHEMTHFFRYINSERNLWFHYFFAWDSTLEEWIAVYNEYKYWNKIMDYWDYKPYYNFCYKVLSEDITEDEKISKIYRILINKWLDEKKSKAYYYRFYRYTTMWSKDFFLKDLIYMKAYKTVKEYLKSDNYNYEKIMAWKIWVFELENNIVPHDNNFDSLEYFDKMVKKINSLIK